MCPTISEDAHHKIQNPGCAFDEVFIKNTFINLSAVNERAERLATLHEIIKGEYKAAWLLKAITLIDLTTLAGDDTGTNVTRLCHKATFPIPQDLLEALGYDYDDENCPIHTAAVCVYPSQVECASKVLQRCGFDKKINVASVATGFPSGQYPLHTRLEEIKYAVSKGAKEIDIVINRSLVFAGKWKELYDELCAMKKACGEGVHLKAILATGELGNLNNVYKASMVAMMAGSDFIKTSTGKEAINATLTFGIVMARAIQNYLKATGFKVGLKPAGGIKTSKDAISWLIMIKEELGDEWLSPELFRFGASGLLSDIEHNLFTYVTGLKAIPYEFTMG